MMRFNLSCELGYDLAGDADFLLNVASVKNAYQRVTEEEFDVEPKVSAQEYVDPQSRSRYLRLHARAGKLNLRYRATVELQHFIADPAAIAEVPVADLPAETFQFLFPSRYCESDLLARMALREFGALPPGHSRVAAICDWVKGHVEYVGGTTTSQTSAYDTATQQVGVCRDFAHLTIAFCRALNIPARYATGYAYGLDPPSDFHAYVEAYLGNRWFTFDPSQMAPRTGVVRVGTGRDAADVSFATIFGPATMSEMKIAVDLAPASDIPRHGAEALANC
jgi:transglutaminase-like putative cysteine protease